MNALPFDAVKEAMFLANASRPGVEAFKRFGFSQALKWFSPNSLKEV